MKATNSILCLAFAAMVIGCDQGDKGGDPQKSDIISTVETGPAYDSILAKKLGADDYGMKSYVFALLKAGPNRDQDSTSRAQIQRAHLDNITRMAEEGTLVAAGPFMEAGDFQGIYVFNVETIEEAEALTKSDPAVQAGRLVFEFYPWYSSASLQLINEWHKKVAKVNF